MLQEALTTDKSEEQEEKQIVALDGDELHHLKMIALRYLEEHTTLRQILQETLTEQEEVMKRVYDTAQTAQDHRENRNDISKYQNIRMTVSARDATAIMAALGECPEEDWITQGAWRRSVHRLVNQVDVGWEWYEVSQHVLD